MMLAAFTVLLQACQLISAALKASYICVITLKVFVATSTGHLVLFSWLLNHLSVP